jgi:hypothetical protein
MSNNSTFIADIVAGQAAGDRFLREVDGFSSPDALAIKLIEIMASDGPGNPQLRGFARAIQKRLERIAQRSGA